MEFHYDRALGRMEIPQYQFILRICERFNQVSSSNIHNPAQVSIDLVVVPLSSSETKAMASRPYRSLIGSLLYVATTTRPDIPQVIAHFSRYLESPSNAHWKAAIRVLHYLKTTRCVGVCYQARRRDFQVEAFSDSDWASGKDNRKPVSGTLVLTNGGPAVFNSRPQRTVALSSTEAEYMALSVCTQEVVWVRNLLSELGVPQPKPTIVFVGNQSAVAIATNVGYQSRTKHIDIRRHFVRDHVAKDTIKLLYIPTKLQLANYQTKPLSQKQFDSLRKKSGVGVARL